MSFPIIFVHGAFCGGWAFDAFRAPFEAAGYETHAPFLPHHQRGGDLERLAQCGVKDFADAIGEYARDLGRPAILIGHSLGGLVVQLAAMQAPAAALVTIGPSAPWGVSPTTLDEHGNSFGLSLLGDYWRRPAPPDFSIAMRTTLDRLPREEAKQVFARFVPESGRAIMETVQWWLDQSQGSAAPPARISAPVLALAGGCDRVNPASTVRRMVERFPTGQAHFYEFPSMSHWLIGEPEWPHVAQMALNWLSERGLVPSRGLPGAKRTRRANPRMGAISPV